MPQVIIADGHGLYRRGFRSAMQAGAASIEVFEASCLDSLLALLEEVGSVNAVIVDLPLLGSMSLGVLREVRSIYPDTRFAVISASVFRLDVLSALAAGVHGFISKAQTDDEIVGAVTDILSGRVYVPPLLADGYPAGHVLMSGGTPVAPARPAQSVEAGGPGHRGREDEMDKLTPRQREVLQLIAEGLPNKEIAQKLRISEATTKIHACALMRALGVRNRTEAAVLVQNALVERKG